MIKIACAQLNVVFGDPRANAERAKIELKKLAEEGVRLVVFPEAFLTGYCVDACDKAMQIAIERKDPAILDLSAACDEYGILAVVGFAEEQGECLYNTAALLEPGCEPRFYRKTHLPELGLDKHVRVGDELPVFETCLGKIGIIICFDMRPPEAARTLALKGAQLIVLPTNWPEGAEVSAGYIAVARAGENRVFFAACNRVGDEHGFRFIGSSKIVGLTGRILAAAGDQEETIIAEIDLDLALSKRNVIDPGRFETEIFATRRPELYGPITAPK